MLAWTVNEVEWMEWCIRKNQSGNSKGKESERQQLLPKEEHDEGDTSDTTTAAAAASAKCLIDGVITDDPKLYLEVCERLEDQLDGKESARSRLESLPVNRGLKGRVGAWTQYLTFSTLIPLFFWIRVWEGKLNYFKDPRTLEL